MDGDGVFVVWGAIVWWGVVHVVASVCALVGSRAQLRTVKERT